MWRPGAGRGKFPQWKENPPGCRSRSKKGGFKLNIIEILKEFDGIIGTALGAVATLVTTKWMESWGRLQYFFKEVKITYFKSDEYGDYSKTESISEAEYVRVEFKVEVYNSSSVIKPLKDIKAVIITENNYIETSLLDIDAYKVVANFKKYDELLHANFKPKEIKGYNLMFGLKQSNFKYNKVEKIKEIYFTARDERNHIVKVLIYKDS